MGCWIEGAAVDDVPGLELAGVGLVGDAWTLPAEVTSLLMIGQVLSVVYAVRAWRHKRWAAMAVNLSVIALTAVALLGAFD